MMASRSASITSKLSPSEQRLLALLRAAPTTTEELARLYFMRRAKPFNHRQIISNLARMLERKTLRSRPKVRRSKRTGPKPIDVWLE